MVVLVEVSRKPYLASLVPVIVNAILSEHQIIVDIIAFVSRGDFPRSRLGEKQRGKILAGWVTRKLRTLAQFAIRDVDPAAMGDAAAGAAGAGAGAAHRQSTASIRSVTLAAAGPSSLKNVENAPQIMEQEELQRQMDRIADMAPAGGAGGAPGGCAAPAAGPRDGPPPRIRMPGVDGRESMDVWSGDDEWTRSAVMHYNLGDDAGPRHG